MSNEAVAWIDEFFGPPGPPITVTATGTIHNVVSTQLGVSSQAGVRFTGAAPTVTGFEGGRPGRRMFVFAVGGPVVLVNESGSSAAINRIVTGTGGNITLAQHAVAWLVYDGHAERWKVASGVGGAEAGSGTEGPFLDNASSGTLHNVTSVAAGLNAAGIRFSGAAPVITGIEAGFAPRLLVLFATGGPLVLNHDDAGSTGDNRILTPTGAPITIPDEGSALLSRDVHATTTRWRVVATSSGGATLNGTTKGLVARVSANEGIGDAFWTREAAGRIHTDFHQLPPGINLSFTSGANTIALDSGTWAGFGFVQGETIYIDLLDGTADAANVGPKTITNLAGATATVAEALVTENNGSEFRVRGGGYQTIGLPSGTFPVFGMRRVATPSAGNEETVLDAIRDIDGDSIPVTTVNGNADIMIGGQLEDANSTNGISTRKSVNVITFGDFLLVRSDEQRWQHANTGIVVKVEQKSILSTEDATPTPFTLPSFPSSSLKEYCIIFEAIGSSASAVWVYAKDTDGGGWHLQRESKTGGASAWTLTESGGTFTATGAAATSITWKPYISSALIGSRFCTLDGSNVVRHKVSGNITTIPDFNGTLPTSGGASSEGSAGELQTTDGAGGFDAATNVKAGSDHVSIGSGTVHATARIRLPYNGGATRIIMGTRTAAAVDVGLLQDGAGDTWLIGNTSMDLQINQAVGNIFCTSNFTLASGSVNALVTTGSKFGVAQPLSGSSGDSQPFRFKRAAIVKVGTSDHTGTSAQYECPIVDWSGTPGGNFNAIWPDSEGSAAIHKNRTPNILTVKKSGGTGITVASNDAKWVFHDATDYAEGST